MFGFNVTYVVGGLWGCVMEYAVRGLFCVIVIDLELMPFSLNIFWFLCISVIVVNSELMPSSLNIFWFFFM